MAAAGSPPTQPQAVRTAIHGDGGGHPHAAAGGPELPLPPPPPSSRPSPNYTNTNNGGSRHFSVWFQSRMSGVIASGSSSGGMCPADAAASHAIPLYLDYVRVLNIIWFTGGCGWLRVSWFRPRKLVLVKHCNWQQPVVVGSAWFWAKEVKSKTGSGPLQFSEFGNVTGSGSPEFGATRNRTKLAWVGLNWSLLGPHDDSVTTTGSATTTLGTTTWTRAMAVVGGPPTPTTTTATTTLQQSPWHDNDGIGHYGAAASTRVMAWSANNCCRHDNGGDPDANNDTDTDPCADNDADADDDADADNNTDNDVDVDNDADNDVDADNDADNDDTDDDDDMKSCTAGACTRRAGSDRVEPVFETSATGHN
ncbi:hypothetical protein EDB89DRAFT_1914928 [Lactarius sanguifluus]|nr:hypothetical protein EDB89DRAFT_1914928 [Lactarius sanguifluus]